MPEVAGTTPTVERGLEGQEFADHPGGDPHRPVGDPPHYDVPLPDREDDKSPQSRFTENGPGVDARLAAKSIDALGSWDIIKSTAVSAQTTDNIPKVLADFQASLFQLVNSSKPQNAEAPSKRFLRLYINFFTPWASYRWMDYEELVAKYVGLWSTLERPDATRFSTQALLGIKLILAGRFSTASKIYDEIEFQVSTPAALSYVMRGVLYFLKILAIIILAPVYILYQLSEYLTDSCPCSGCDGGDTAVLVEQRAPSLLTGVQNIAV